MRSLRALLLILAMIAVGALPAAADMAIKLKDGRVITVPVSPQDVDSITFTAPHSAAAAPAPAPAAAAPPAAPIAANLPSRTLAMAPLAPETLMNSVARERSSTVPGAAARRMIPRPGAPLWLRRSGGSS